eukprot:TRINITY_DN14629_c0_g1_i1.p1 TRINITY_DN14629_c0_g1~~TRINITY_DN14629_c0_g1_i1.p1  ORF type:complete len:297 (+),score=51.66 TRINITY_DN14629_c0_g1_i1:174-1064(+)
MNFYPISPSPRSFLGRYSMLRSNSPFLTSHNKHSTSSMRLGSSYKSNYNSERRIDTPHLLMSRLYSELQAKGGAGELLEEQKEEASPQGISSAKRLQPESSSPRIKTKRKVTKFTEIDRAKKKSEPHIKAFSKGVKEIQFNPGQKLNQLENENQEEANASNPELDRNSQEDDNDPDSDYGSHRDGGRFHCKGCGRTFKSAQAVGGHMSRKHPGESREYNRKAAVRKRRVIDRARLLLAKKMLCQELGYDYEILRTTKHGRLKLKALITRTKLNKFRMQVTKKQLEDFIGDRRECDL